MASEGGICGNVKLGICLETLKCKGKIDSCNHTFHFKCILRWSYISNVCPTCRKSFAQIEHFRGSKFLKKVFVSEDCDSACNICHVDENQELLVLCDGEDCDKVYHTYCVGLESYPRSRFLCAECQARDSGDSCSEFSESDAEQEEDVEESLPPSEEEPTYTVSEEEMSDPDAEYTPEYTPTFTTRLAAFYMRKDSESEEEPQKLPLKRPKTDQVLKKFVGEVVDEQISPLKHQKRNWSNIKRKLVSKILENERLRNFKDHRTVQKMKCFAKSHLTNLISK